MFPVSRTAQRLQKTVTSSTWRAPVQNAPRVPGHPQTRNVVHLTKHATRTTRTNSSTSAARLSRWIAARSLRGSRFASTDGPVRQQIQKHAPEGIKAKLRELSQKYGWAAVGVYLGLSALDFPFCFLAVRMLGAERVGQAEHFVVDRFWRLIGLVTPSGSAQKVEEAAGSVDESAAREAEAEAIKGKNGDGATIWTQLLIAYGVHKSLIFFRVPLTAAVTPRVVKFLRARGWKIGKPSP